MNYSHRLDPARENFEKLFTFRSEASGGGGGEGGRRRPAVRKAIVKDCSRYESDLRGELRPLRSPSIPHFACSLAKIRRDWGGFTF